VSLSGALGALAAGLGLLLIAAPSARGQAESDAEWTVLTVAHNGAWGLSTARSQGEAIAGALRQCQSRSPDPADCGAELVAYRIGWGLAILCGDHRVVVSADDLAAAEAAAYERIAALKQSYASGLPPCRRLVTVDPAGAVMTVKAPDG
jgi:hypothetical protein